MVNFLHPWWTNSGYLVPGVYYWILIGLLYLEFVKNLRQSFHPGFPARLLQADVLCLPLSPPHPGDVPACKNARGLCKYWTHFSETHLIDWLMCGPSRASVWYRVTKLKRFMKFILRKKWRKKLNLFINHLKVSKNVFLLSCNYFSNWIPWISVRDHEFFELLTNFFPLI